MKIKTLEDFKEFRNNNKGLDILRLALINEVVFTIEFDNEIKVNEKIFKSIVRTVDNEICCGTRFLDTTIENMIEYVLEEQ